MTEFASASSDLRAMLWDISDVVVDYDAEFGSKTTYRVGGRCSARITCGTLAALEAVLDLIAPRPIFVLGNGSNTLVGDRGWDGIVLVLSGEFEQIEIAGDRVILGAAVSLPVAARQLAAAGLGGMEWAVGIPGTVGGAVKMNAGGHGSQTSSWLEDAKVFRFSENGYELRAASSSDLSMGYRSSNIGDRDVVGSASFRLVSTKPPDSKRIISDIVNWRRDNQPGGQNAGSVFVNPENDHAARLIESLGLKGFKYKSAEVSSKHANFIQATPGGSADDVFDLIWLVQQQVEKELGIRLRTEIKLIGFDPDRASYLRGV
ncbi:MAG: UDP-N-acetylmuramate dehydrogenase [Actinomycetota bacterium]|nr:MAG: UDP-N-acetylmuramate dehydrogenase [Actinomycetota bacterium]